MDSKIVLIPVDIEDLMQQFREIVKAEIQAKQALDYQEKLLSSKEACQLFQPSISLVTLNKWAKDGRIQSHRIGGRVYYLQKEIIASLKTLKKYKKSV